LGSNNKTQPPKNLARGGLPVSAALFERGCSPPQTDPISQEGMSTALHGGVIAQEILVHSRFRSNAQSRKMNAIDLIFSYLYFMHISQSWKKTAHICLHQVMRHSFTNWTGDFQRHLSASWHARVLSTPERACFFFLHKRHLWFLPPSSLSQLLSTLPFLVVAASLSPLARRRIPPHHRCYPGLRSCRLAVSTNRPTSLSPCLAPPRSRLSATSPAVSTSTPPAVSTSTPPRRRHARSTRCCSCHPNIVVTTSRRRLLLSPSPSTPCPPGSRSALVSLRIPSHPSVLLHPVYSVSPACNQKRGRGAERELPLCGRQQQQRPVAAARTPSAAQPRKVLQPAFARSGRATSRSESAQVRLKPRMGRVQHSETSRRCPGSAPGR